MLKAAPNPSDQEIAALPNICRCGAYPRILRAIRRAAQESTPALPAGKDEQSPAQQFTDG
jgi:isoquinoline 1-oxidoreductase alpha subunit